MTGTQAALSELDRARLEDGLLDVDLKCSGEDCRQEVSLFYSHPIEWVENEVYYNLIDDAEWTHDEKGRWLCEECSGKVANKEGE